MCVFLSIPWVRCECRSRACSIMVAPIMAAAITAPPLATSAGSPPTAAVCRKATPRGPRRSRQIQPLLPAAPVDICRAMISPISAMSVAKITATKGGAGRDLNLKDPKGRLPKPRQILKIHRPLSRTTHRRENRTANQPLSWTPVPRVNIRHADYSCRFHKTHREMSIYVISPLG
jgi:hypothetical protein